MAKIHDLVGVYIYIYIHTPQIIVASIPHGRSSHHRLLPGSAGAKRYATLVYLENMWNICGTYHLYL